MKILHITPSYKPAYIYGGVIESVSRLCECLADAGHQVDVFTTTANGKAELSVEPAIPANVEGVNVWYFPRVTKDPTQASPGLWWHLFKHCTEYEVVHVHSWWNPLAVVATWICQLRRQRVVLSPRGMLCEYIFNATRVQTKKWIHRVIGRRTLARSIFHATAESEYDECMRLIPGWRGFVLPNLLSLPEMKKKTRGRNSILTLLFLSRIHQKKGLELLLEAMKSFPFPIRLRIAGSGESDYVDALKERIEASGLTQQVEWLGWVDRQRKFEALMNSDLFVLTSHNENFANVVIEALHVGTPVLISDRVGLASFVKDKGLGWVTSLEVKAIRTALFAAYKDVRRRHWVNVNGRETVAKHFSESVLIRQYVSWYKMISENGFTIGAFDNTHYNERYHEDSKRATIDGVDSHVQ